YHFDGDVPSTAAAELPAASKKLYFSVLGRVSPSCSFRRRQSGRVVVASATQWVFSGGCGVSARIWSEIPGTQWSSVE
ncbi:hypothetical protein A2U01_0098219, partial [Trifolium medium]|nr:hypothetical protein [Trifolium medium]